MKQNKYLIYKSFFSNLIVKFDYYKSKACFLQTYWEIVKDCIALTSEAINVLDKRCFGGNLALKIDVSKAFDTLS